MLEFLENIPQAPVEDIDDQRRSKLLNIMLFGIGSLTFLAFIGLVVSSLFTKFRAPGLYVGIISLLTGIMISAWLNRNGNVTYAGVLFIGVLTLVFASVDTPEQTIMGRTLFMFVIPVLMSSFVIQPAASFVTLAVVAALHIGIAGLTPVKEYTPIGLLGFAAIALGAWLAANNLETALYNLQKINRELDQRVMERTHELAQANDQLTVQTAELARTNLLLEEQTHVLADANLRLQSLDELKSRFVSDVSHELRTPISNLSIYLEMLEGGHSERNERYLNVLRDETARLRKLVNDVLDLSRMEMGTTKTEMAWLDLNAIVEKVVIANRLRAEAKGLELSFRPAEGLPLLWADADQLSQVANNIIGNSVNYTLSGSVEVSTILDEKVGEMSLLVKDTGIGIDQADIPHLFERFYRGKQTRQSNIPGTGLGLAITNEIIERLRGDIQVESTVGKGTLFKISFPIQKQPTKDVA